MKRLSFENYDMLIVDNLESKVLKNEFKEFENKRSFIITDENVWALYEKDFKYLPGKKQIFTVKSGDSNKSFKNYEELVEQLIEAKVSKNDLIIAIGGGVVLDLAGFVASTIKRGVPRINIPTTIIGQIDAAFGGKVAINSRKYKNQIGLYSDPILVVSPVDYLKTLKDIEIKNGLGELIKTAIIGSKKFYKKVIENLTLDENMIYDAVLVKKELVEKDYYAKHERNALNLGHTFGHAIEASSNFKVGHGLAVFYGIKIALELGEGLGITPTEVKEKITKDINKFDIQLKEYKIADLKKYILVDKKIKNNMIKLVFVEEIGEIAIVDVNVDDLDEILS